MRTSNTRWFLGFTALLFAFSASTLSAAPVACGSASTLQSLITDGTCQYGNTLFSNFLFNFSAGTSGESSPTVPGANDVVVTFSSPDGLDSFGNPLDPTLEFSFSANNTVGAFQTMNLTIQYQVDIAAGWTAQMVGMDGSATGAYTTNQTIGEDSFTAAAHPLGFLKAACMGAGFDTSGAPLPTQDPQSGGCSATSATVLGSNLFTYAPPENLDLANTTSLSNTFLFPDGNVSRTVGAYDSFTLNGGTSSNSASDTQTAAVISFQNSFDQEDLGPTPEPSTTVLIGAALLVLGVCVRRKRTA